MLENAAVLGTSGSDRGTGEFAGGWADVFTSMCCTSSTSWARRGARPAVGVPQRVGAVVVALTKPSPRLPACTAARRGVAKAMSVVAARRPRTPHAIPSAAELVQELGSVDKVPHDVVEQAISSLAAAADRAFDCSLRMAVRHTSRALDLSAAGRFPQPARGTVHWFALGATSTSALFDTAAADIEALHSIAEVAASPRARGRVLATASPQPGCRSLSTVVAPASARRSTCSDGWMTPHCSPVRCGCAASIEMFRRVAGRRPSGLRRGRRPDAALDDERGLCPHIEQHRAWIAFRQPDHRPRTALPSPASRPTSGWGDRNGVGWAFGCWRLVRVLREGHFDGAEALAATVAQEAESRGDVWAASMMNTPLADLRLWQGQSGGRRAAENALHGSSGRESRSRAGARPALCRAQVGSAAGPRRSAAREKSVNAPRTARRIGPAPPSAVAGAAMIVATPSVAAAMGRAGARTYCGTAGGGMFEPVWSQPPSYAELGRLDEGRRSPSNRCPPRERRPRDDAVAATAYTAVGQPEAASADDSVAHASGATYLDAGVRLRRRRGRCSADGRRRTGRQRLPRPSRTCARRGRCGGLLGAAIAGCTSPSRAPSTRHDPRTELGRRLGDAVALAHGHPRLTHGTGGRRVGQPASESRRQGRSARNLAAAG